MLFYDEGAENVSIVLPLGPDLFFQMQAFFNGGIHCQRRQQVGQPQPGEQKEKGTARNDNCYQQPVAQLEHRRKGGAGQKAEEHTELESFLVTEASNRAFCIQ